MVAGSLANQDAIVEIYNKAKAAAGRPRRDRRHDQHGRYLASTGRRAPSDRHGRSLATQIGAEAPAQVRAGVAGLVVVGRVLRGAGRAGRRRQLRQQGSQLGGAGQLLRHLARQLREALEGGFDGPSSSAHPGHANHGARHAALPADRLPLAYLLAIKIQHGKGLVLALLAIPFFTNFLIRTLAWRIVLAPKGLISNTLLDWGLIDEQRLNLLDSRTGVQIGVVYNYLPLMIFPLFVALDRLDPALREGSKDLFADRLATFRQVTLPLARPGIIAGIVLVFVPLAAASSRPTCSAAPRATCPATSSPRSSRSRRTCRWAPPSR